MSFLERLKSYTVERGRLVMLANSAQTTPRGAVTSRPLHARDRLAQNLEAGAALDACVASSWRKARAPGPSGEQAQQMARLVVQAHAALEPARDKGM